MLLDICTKKNNVTQIRPRRPQKRGVQWVARESIHCSRRCPSLGRRRCQTVGRPCHQLRPLFLPACCSGSCCGASLSVSPQFPWRWQHGTLWWRLKEKSDSPFAIGAATCYTEHMHFGVMEDWNEMRRLTVSEISCTVVATALSIHLWWRR